MTSKSSSKAIANKLTCQQVRYYTYKSITISINQSFAVMQEIPDPHTFSFPKGTWGCLNNSNCRKVQVFLSMANIVTNQ